MLKASSDLEHLPEEQENKWAGHFTRKNTQTQQKSMMIQNTVSLKKKSTSYILHRTYYGSGTALIVFVY